MTGAASFAAVISLVSVYVGAAFAKSLFPAVGPEGVAALRVGLAALMLLLALQPWRLKLSRQHSLDLLGYGVVLGLMNTLIYRAFAYIPLGIAIAIEVLGPLALALWSSKNRRDWAWIFLAICGIGLLPAGVQGQALDWRGVAFALAAALCWSLYIAAGKRIAPLGARGVAIGMTVAGLEILPLGVMQAGLSLVAPEVLWTGLGVALLSSALPYLLDNYALKYLPQSRFGILMSASPAISAMAGALVLNETLSAQQWAGIAAISAACLGSAMATSPTPQRAT